MPLIVRQDDLLMRLVKDVNDIRSMLRRTVANLPLFDISNENTPDQIVADQNNYVPGNFDVLRISSDAARTITGIRGGVKGRFLRLINVGNFEITLSHLSLLSDAGNRIVSPTGQDIVINVNGDIVLYYDYTQSRWMANWASGANRKSCRLRLTDDQTIPDSIDTALIWGSAVEDTGGFWDVLNPTIVTIPETGWYDINAQLVWSDTVADGTVYTRSAGIIDQDGYFIAIDSKMPMEAASDPLMSNIGRPIYRVKGSTVQVLVFQTTGAGATIKATISWCGACAGVAYTEFNIVRL